MNNSDLKTIFVMILIFLIFGGFTLLIVHNHKELIRDHLKKKGAKNIVVSWMSFDFDESNHSYFVNYEDARGSKHERSCKIHRLGSSIYWGEEEKEQR
jgi:hypothetical protein